MSAVAFGKCIVIIIGKLQYEKKKWILLVLYSSSVQNKQKKNTPPSTLH